MAMEPWRDFKGDFWRKNIDVRDFIRGNYQPYFGDESFLAGPTERTNSILRQYLALQEQEQASGGVLDIDTAHISSPLSYPAGYIDKDREIIVGLQTDAPLKRSVNPFGGIRMARAACKAYGREVGEDIEKIFAYRSSHNDGVFRVYTEEMRAARNSGVITGLPDSYGRGRIIGDYRRVALYGVDELIERKLNDRAELCENPMTNRIIHHAEELWKQADFLQKLKEMAWLYGYDISRPAVDSRQAVQWLYFAYLAAIKEQNGAAMSLGRVSTFLDIYFARDMAEGTLDETGVQEMIDDFVIKLRLARQLRTPDYNELFAGDPTWVTEAIGGMSENGQSMVTRTSYRFLHTLRNLGPAPEPNLTVLWSRSLPANFKRYCAQLSIETDSIQYESDDVMRPIFGDDYAIACCVSAMRVGKQMQYFGARCNLPKLLLMALNGGCDEITGRFVGPNMPPMKADVLNYDDVITRFNFYRDWLCRLYVNMMNVIHYMHDKYAYEKVQMALHDSEVERFMAFGISGLSVVVDSLSAIKYAKVKPIYDERGLITDFVTEGEFPKFGNDNRDVDDLAVTLVEEFLTSLKKNTIYRNAIATLSILTITSNVVYGQMTGSTPDGRKHGEPFAPGANPMHKREKCGALASLNSVAKIPYSSCRDGISCTFSIAPSALGARPTERAENLIDILDGYFTQGAQHLNVNVLDREKLVDAMENPAKYPNLTIRVSGYAVNFHRLTRAQQEEVIARTYHQKV